MKKIILVFSVLLLAASCNQSVKQSNNTQPVSDNGNQQVSSTNTPPDGFVTYTSPEFGIQLSHPKDYTVSSFAEEGSVGEFDQGLKFSSSKGTFKLSVNNQIIQGGAPSYDSQSFHLILGIVQVDKYSGSYSQSPDMKGTHFVNYYFNHGSDKYSVELTGADTSMSPDVEAIIKTLVFTR